MKIKLTETQLQKIKEDNLLSKKDPIDGFIEQGNISGLAHHYAKADDDGKNGIISKAKAAKGDVFAQKIKVKAQGVLEGENTLEETTDTGSVGGQYSSKYFLDASHAKNPPSIFKGGTVIKPNEKTHTSGVNSFTVVKGKLKEDIFQEVENVIKSSIGELGNKENVTPEVTEPALVSQTPMVDEDMQQSMSNASNYDKIPREVVKLANKLDALIKLCVDSDGDPVGVYDNTSTWQKECIFSVDLVNNKLVIKFTDYMGAPDYSSPVIYPEGKKRVWDYWSTQDAIDELREIIKNYNRTIKAIPKRQAKIDKEMMDQDLSEYNVEINSTVQSVPEPPHEESQNQFTTESLYDIYEDVCADTGEDSEEAGKLKNILIEFGDYDNPDMEINSQAIEEFKRVLPETTGAGSSGSFAPALGEPITRPMAEDSQEMAVPTETTSNGLTGLDLDTLIQNFGEENVKHRGSTETASIADVTVNGKTYVLVALDRPYGVMYVARDKATNSFDTFETLDGIIDILKGDEGKTIMTSPNTSIPLQEESLTLSPAIANLKRIHGETAKITKASMQKTKKDTIKATEANGTQFINNNDGVDSSESDNSIGIDNTPQQDEIAMIRKGMEDLEYNGGKGEAFEERFEDNIDRDLSTDAVTDQFGHTTPAGEMSNVLKSDVGANIVANVKKKEDEPDAPMYSKEAVPVKIMKEEIYMETEAFIITKEEKKRMDEEAMRIKQLIGYKPSAVISTKGNKRNDGLFKSK